MARPRSDDKRAAIMAAAVRVIVEQGLSAPTAVIAREAGVANGSLFTYFPTKVDLFNQLYVELKAGMAAAAEEATPTKASLRDQYFHVWSNWMRWAVRHPDKRRALARLGTWHDLTPESRAMGHRTMAGLAGMMDRARAKGPMRDLPFPFVASLMNAMAETTMDFMLQEPKKADAHRKAGFDALWRMLS